jgi:hypothetical protein
MWLACSNESTPSDPIVDSGPSEPTSTEDVTDDIEVASDATGGIKFDIVRPPYSDVSVDKGPAIDKDAGIECRALATSRMPPPDGICPADAGMPMFRSYACLPAPESGTCEDAYSEACVLNTYACGISQRATGIWCGPLVDTAGQCCYVTWGNCFID